VDPLFLQDMIAAPGGTTHYKIISAGAEIILKETLLFQF
jgi:hypothetical protein